MEYKVIFYFSILFLDCSREYCIMYFFDLFNILGYFIDVILYCGDFR